MHSSLEWYQDLLDRVDSFDLKYIEGKKESFKFKGQEYSNMFKPDIKALNFNIFASNYDAKNNLAYFTLPVFSDSSNKAALQQTVYPITGRNTTIKDKLLNLALVELQRINVIRENEKAVAKRIKDLQDKNPNVDPIITAQIAQTMRTGFDNLDIHGNKFQFLTFLNKSELNLDNISEEILVTKDGVQTLSKNAENTILNSINAEMENNFSEYVNELISNGLVSYENGKIIRAKNSPISRNVSENLLRQYYYNQFYYNAALQIVLGGDLAYYKKGKLEDTIITEAQKRFKQVDSPYSRGLWGNKKTQKVIFLKDVKIPTAQETVDGIIHRCTRPA